MTALTPRSAPAAGPPAGRPAGGRALAIIPWAAALAVAGLVAAALTLAVLNQATIQTALTQYFAVTISAGLSFGVAGIVIALKRPDLRIGWLLCTAALATSIPPFTAQYARYALVTHPGSLPAGRLAGWLTVWDWPAGYALVLVGVALLFPDVQALGRRERLVAWLAAVAVALIMASNAVSPRTNPALPEVPNPYGLAGASRTGLAGQAIGTLMLLAAMVGALILLAARYRHGSERQRQQVRWFLLAFAVLAVAEILGRTVGFAVTHRPADSAVLGWAEAAAVPWLSVAIGVAVLRHRLYEIDFLINRTLVYVTMSGLVVGVYVLVVGYLGAWLNVHGAGVALIATGLVAVAFHPVREQVQRGVNRLLYGRRDEPYTVLTELGRRLEASLSPDSVLATIAASVREALRVPYAGVTVRGVIGAPAAESGSPAPVALRLPLVFGSEQVGELAVAGRQPGEQLSAADRRLLADFARQAGIAAHTVRLSTDLQAARERLVTAREEERRRLRRDLHDGLGPHLASQALTLDAARSLVRDDPAAAEAVLTELREQTQQAVAEIRRIVNDLRPSALDDHGLLGALSEHAARYARTGLEVTIDGPSQLPPLPAAVDLAAYRIAAEAVTNAARHAGARRCSVTLTSDDAARLIRLEVRDDGCGLPSSPRPGLGLASMRARASELGGQCSISSQPGAGTRVIAQLPVPMDAPVTADVPVTTDAP